MAADYGLSTDDGGTADDGFVESDFATANDAASQDVNDALNAAFPPDVYSAGDLAVSQFAQSGLTDSLEVADYIEQEIPAEHLAGLDNIQYVNDPGAYESGLMGMWQSDPTTGETSIKVYPHDDRNEMFDTIAHEIGHNAEAVLQQENPTAIETWNQIYAEGIGKLAESSGEQNEFVTPYAETSPEEDFAESYATYLNDPDLLTAVSPAKHAFMDEQVFL